ncbi:LLM class flavin-dependent oxidoreductase [Haloarchaeobius sp. TZWWS8]|uniref:LLM class flavin-dependent oxidoreductase n=1 Tax=Haloarchaeobius sp. TZWWS8 TaxID=3446121 RepID=UPI003EB94C46
MKHGVWLTDSAAVGIDRLVEFGVEAEAAGWDGVFVSDSLPYSNYPDPWVLLAGIAARTQDIALGTWVVPAPRRHPWQLAQEVATLDQLSDGRVLFGVGIGNTEDYEAFGQPVDARERGAILDETLDIVTGLWSGEPFSYDGEHFTLVDAEVHPTPVQQPRVPILAGGWWPNKKPFHRGARWDGIMPYFPSLVAEGTGPHGEVASGAPREEMRAALEYYHDIATTPGQILVPRLSSMPGPENVAFCEELGVTWILTTELGDDAETVLETIRAGPPR